MTTAPAITYRGVLATAGFFTLIAGDFWRYLLTWWGWGAIVLLLVILELVRRRRLLERQNVLIAVRLIVIDGAAEPVVGHERRAPLDDDHPVRPHLDVSDIRPDGRRARHAEGRAPEENSDASEPS